MRRRTTPIGWPRRDSRHYRFVMPNAVWEYKLKLIEFVIFSYLCYHCAPGMLTPEIIAADAHMTATTVKKYLDSLSAKKLVNEDGTPALNCKDKNFFILPNEVFLLRLPPSAFLVYAYLLLIEDRRTHTCHPSYNTIAAATGLAKNTAMKSIGALLEMGLIQHNKTSRRNHWRRLGQAQNGSWHPARWRSGAEVSSKQPSPWTKAFQWDSSPDCTRANTGPVLQSHGAAHSPPGYDAS